LLDGDNELIQPIKKKRVTRQKMNRAKKLARNILRKLLMGYFFEQVQK
jgi:hypothetical protein